MAYASVATNEHETLYNGNGDDNSNNVTVQTASPTLPEFSHRPLSLSFEDISGAVAVIDPTASNSSHGSEAVGNILKSLSASSHSYEMVEDDDYEDQLATPRGLHFKDRPTSDGANLAATSEQHPVRTASVSRHLPLNHPTPDLQSMQGAYVKNVERLEESAERLSTMSSLDDELQRIRSEQRRVERSTSNASSHASRNARPTRQFSGSSFSNSIIGVNHTARTGQYSPSAYITSPTGSIPSGSWAQNGTMQRRTSKTSRLAGKSQDAAFQSRPRDESEAMSSSHRASGIEERLDDTVPMQRPPTSTLIENQDRRDDPFADFDGAHYDGRGSIDRASLRRISLQRPPLARDSKAYREAQPGEKMIYYPAPVPVMLNLPTRLSRMNFTDREKRRLQALSGIPDEMRKSAAWLANENLGTPDKRNTVILPPQLRASAFFDQPSTANNVELKNGSAVQTLESILDAAAHAPVSAFTDHPIVGRLGKEVYGTEKSSRKSAQLDKEMKKKRRSSLSNILKSKKSNGDLDGEDQGRITSRESKVLDQEHGASGDELGDITRSFITPGEDEIADTPVDGEADSDAESSESEHRPGFSGAPTTLLAELQLRKAAQKQRNRTAADAFPNGMHSTLLELDAVTQLQQRSRKQKHVTLAWEDHAAAERENFDDEDVPLGVLFPEKERADHPNINRPMGLMEKKEMEDNEPLSQRRARLRGEPVQAPRAQSIAASQLHNVEDNSTKYKIDIPGMSGTELDEPEEETLAQRLKRMKEEKEKATAGNFASDVSSQLGLKVDDAPIETSKTPEAEETLGQRRKRLQEEATRRPPLKARHSMADILQANPVGQRQVSSESQKQQSRGLPRFNTFGPTNSSTAQVHNGVPIPQLPAHMATLPYYNHAPYMNPAGNASAHMVNGINGYYGYGGMQQMVDPGMGPPLDPRQRAVIDRWRQGIV